MEMAGTNYRDDLAWARQVAAGWARRLLAGDSPAAWATDTEKQVQFALRHLQVKPGDAVLDLGCGWGRHSLPLAAHGLRVTALDVSHELLALARLRARRPGGAVHWVEGDIAHVPLRGPFDAVVQFCGNLLTWSPDRDHARALLERVAGLLRPGGRLLFGSEEWLPELPSRAQHWDEWRGGAAIYRQRFDAGRRIAHHQTVIFGPGHRRQEYHHQTWWPSCADMEELFADAGLRVLGRFNNCAETPYHPQAPGLIYVLERVDSSSH